MLDRLKHQAPKILLDFAISLAAVGTAAAIGYYLGRDITLVQLEQTVNSLVEKYDGEIQNEEQAQYQAQIAKKLWGRVQKWYKAKEEFNRKREELLNHHGTEAQAEGVVAKGSSESAQSEREA